MKDKLVSVIIVNYNGGQVFKECLESLNKIKYSNWELIVVDNGSSDDSDNFANKVINSAKKVTLLRNKKNLGFAPANNQGFESSKGEYILCLNNDTKVQPQFLNILIKKMEKNLNWGAVQPKIYIMDKPESLDNAGSFLTRTGFLTHWGFLEKDREEFNQEREIFTAKGACLLTRRKIIEKIGLFDGDYGSYFEESDFCWRVWLAGFKVMYVPSANIYHKVGFTSKRQSQIDVNYHSFKNRIRTLIKNLSLRNLFFIGGLHLILLLGLSFYYLIKFQFSKVWMILKALLWNLFYINETLSLRRSVQKIRLKADEDIFKSVMHPINLIEMFSHFTKVEKNFN